MKYLFLIIAIVLGLNTGYTQPELTDPNITPAPLAVAGTGTLSFNIINLNTPVNGLTMSISMTKVAPTSGALSVTGSGAAYFNWIYLAGINTLFGTQVVAIPANDGGDVVVAVNVTGTSTMALPQNGFTSNISPGGSTVSAYTWTELILPVKYKSITAKSESCAGNNIYWSTASEINNSHFEVEASRDGENFIGIGKVKGGGNVAGDYKFIDENKYANQQAIHYRLKQVDFDGRFEYSDIVSVKYVCEKQIAMALSPNPAKDEIRVEFEGADLEEINAILLDGNGAYVKDVYLSTGTINKVNINNLLPGIYILQAKVDGQQFNQRFIKID